MGPCPIPQGRAYRFESGWEHGIRSVAPHQCCYPGIRSCTAGSAERNKSLGRGDVARGSGFDSRLDREGRATILGGSRLRRGLSLTFHRAHRELADRGTGKQSGAGPDGGADSIEQSWHGQPRRLRAAFESLTGHEVTRFAVTDDPLQRSREPWWTPDHKRRDGSERRSRGAGVCESHNRIGPPQAMTRHRPAPHQVP